jgi:hypothetical protein
VHNVAVLALILHQAFEPIEIAAGTLFDERAPEIDKLSCSRRRSHARQALAHHQRQRILDRRIRALGDLIELAAMKTIVEHRGEILCDAVHAPGADRLHARLLHGFKYSPGLLAGRLQPAMQGVVMTGKTQGN